MRPYDGIDYRYRSGQDPQGEGLEIVAGTLGFVPDAQGLAYDLSLYSGGSGIHDRLAITWLAEVAYRESVRAKLRLVALEEAMADPEWRESLMWLMTMKQGDRPPPAEACAAFINSERFEFQDPCTPDTPVHFANESDVNHWEVVWEANGSFNYLYFDQG